MTSTYIANDMIMPAMLNVINYFNTSQNYISLSLTFFILGGGSLQIFLGPLSDRFGRRLIMLIGVCIFFTSTVLITFSSAIHQFLLLRFIQGMGLCFISVIGYPTVHILFDEIKAIRVISIMNTITIFAPLAGPLLGAMVILLGGIFIVLSAFVWLKNDIYKLPKLVLINNN